jgi:hypothetical protein
LRVAAAQRYGDDGKAGRVDDAQRPARGRPQPVAFHVKRVQPGGRNPPVGRGFELASGPLIGATAGQLAEQRPYRVVEPRIATEQRRTDERDEVPRIERDARLVGGREIAVEAEEQADVQEEEETAELGVDAVSRGGLLVSDSSRRASCLRRGLGSSALRRPRYDP